MQIVNFINLFFNVHISVNFSLAYSPTTLIWLFIIVLFLILIVGINSHSTDIEPTIDSIDILDDGSYCIVWGYINNHPSEIRLNKGESCLQISNGAALIVGNQPPHEFQKGRQKEALKVIALENTEIEWLIKNKKKKIVLTQTHLKKGL